MKQQFSTYTSQDFEVWKVLFERQVNNLQDKACSEYLNALSVMSDVLNADRVPEFTQINEWFKSSTGWEIHCVPGLIPVDDFFRLLSKKQFPSSTWLRSMDQLDYLEEPDMFHDIFGHVPLLSNPIFSAFMQDFGKLGCTFIHDELRLLKLQRLYWFSIEFGLIKQEGLKIYGAGIASSFGESISSLESGPIRSPFDLDIVQETAFETDQVQNHYFVIDSFDQLFQSLQNLITTWKTTVHEQR